MPAAPTPRAALQARAKRASARQSFALPVNTASREPRGDTTGRPAAVADSNDATRSDDSAENRSFPACSRNAARSDDITRLRPAGGQNPRDSDDVTTGEETITLVPRSDDGVVELLDRLKANREEVERTDIEALEAEIDRAVYDPFGSTDGKCEVVEEYLKVA